MTSSHLIAILDWRAALSLKDNLRFLEHAETAGRIRPREWRGRSGRFRSMMLSADGSLELQRFSIAVVTRRVGGVVLRKKKHGLGTEERG